MSEAGPGADARIYCCPARPDGLVRHLPCHNQGHAESHARFASNPEWFAKRGCLAPKAGKQRAVNAAVPRGEHTVRPMIIEKGARGVA
jgi:hypothetical protein